MEKYINLEELREELLSQEKSLEIIERIKREDFLIILIILKNTEIFLTK